MLNKINVYIIYVRYGYEDYKGSLASLFKKFKKIKGIVTKFLIIENNYKANLKNPILNSSNVSIIKGNNQYGEFSGWSKGLSYLKKKKLIGNSDIVCLVTSAYKKKYCKLEYNLFDNLSDKTFLEISKKKICCGKIDFSDIPLKVSNYVFNKWVRSSFLIIKYKNLKKINFFKNLKNVLSENIPKENINYYNRWLKGEKINSGKWRTNYKIINYKLKIKCMYLEHKFSVLLRNQKIKIMNIHYVNLMLHKISQKKAIFKKK